MLWGEVARIIECIVILEEERVYDMRPNFASRDVLGRLSHFMPADIFSDVIILPALRDRSVDFSAAGSVPHR